MRRADADGPAPTALRFSVGVGTTAEDIDAFVDALRALLRGGPAADYVLTGGRLAPQPDPHRRPFACAQRPDPVFLT
jgi:hypothetical protein